MKTITQRADELFEADAEKATFASVVRARSILRALDEWQASVERRLYALNGAAKALLRDNGAGASLNTSDRRVLLAVIIDAECEFSPTTPPMPPTQSELTATLAANASKYEPEPLESEE